MSICVIFNPSSGRGRAARRLARFREKWRQTAEFLPTNGPRHAVELARDAAERGVEIVAAAGGDGTVHEVAQGLLSGEGCDSVLAVVPIGSANDYAHTLRRQFGQRQLDDDQWAPVDVGVIRSADDRSEYFVESVGVGLSARITLASQSTGGQGILRYGVAACRALYRDVAAPELSLTWDDQPAKSTPTLMVSLLLGRREGNFPLAPGALLDDGLFDFVHAGQMSRRQLFAMLPRLAWTGPPEEHPAIRQGRCRSLRIQSPDPLTIHVDGEMFCTPGDACRDVTIELLPKRLRVKLATVN